MHFKKRGELVPLIFPGCAGAYYARLLLTTQFLTFNRLNSQYNSPKFKAIKKESFAMFRLIKHSFKFTIKTRDR